MKNKFNYFIITAHKLLNNKHVWNKSTEKYFKTNLTFKLLATNGKVFKCQWDVLL